MPLIFRLMLAIGIAFTCWEGISPTSHHPVIGESPMAEFGLLLAAGVVLHETGTILSTVLASARSKIKRPGLWLGLLVAVCLLAGIVAVLAGDNGKGSHQEGPSDVSFIYV
jgi:drug/metabolite transporter (DMT)-like permease